MTKQTELIPAAETQLATQEPSVPQMMDAVIKSGITPESVAVMERLVALKERMDDKKAEREFAEAFADVQAKLRGVAANGKADRYDFLKYDDIMAELHPLLSLHGLSVTFSMKTTEQRLTQFCTVTHRGGHSRTNEYTVRLTNKTPGLNECQQDGLAGTYAKRYALCNAFNITVGTDNDGRPDASLEGPAVTWDQAKYLKELVAEVGANEKAFLMFASVDKYDEIPANRYDELVRKLESKRGAR